MRYCLMSKDNLLATFTLSKVLESLMRLMWRFTVDCH